MEANPLKRLYHWVLSWADCPSGTVALFCLAIVESSFFPVPPDVLLIALTLGRRDKVWWFALVCTGGSLLGAAAGYLIGWGLWEATQDFWLSYVFSEEVFHRVSELYHEYDALAIFIAAISFIPYKVFTITAGVFGINVGVFLLASLLGRGARFFAVGATVYWVGPTAKPFIERWFNWLTVAFVGLLLLGFWLLGTM